MAADKSHNTDALVEDVHRAVASANLRWAFTCLDTFMKERSRAGAELALGELAKEVGEHMAALERCEALRRLDPTRRGETEKEMARLTYAALELVDVMVRMFQPPRVATGAGRDHVATLTREGVIGGRGKPDVFVSYAHEDHRLADAVIVSLVTRGFTVWYDQNLAGGERFKSVIDAQIDAVRAVIAVWTSVSAQSDWVRYESDRAHRAGKLVPVRQRGLSIETLPNGFPRDIHVLDFGDDAGVHHALTRLGCRCG